MIYSPGDSAHDLEHERLQNLNRTVTTLPSASANIGGRVSYNGLDYQSNGTLWLSVQSSLMSLEVRPAGLTVNQLVANTANVQFGSHPNNTNDIYLIGIATDTVVNTANSGVSYWQLTVRSRTSSGGAGFSFTGNTSTGGIGPNHSPITIDPSPNNLITRASFYDVATDWAKAGSVGLPGTLNFNPVNLIFKLVGA